jgi:hypothetical protein
MFGLVAAVVDVVVVVVHVQHTTLFVVLQFQMGSL